MDIHTRTVAVMHIVVSVFGALFMLVAAISMRGLGHFLEASGGNTNVFSFVADVGTAIVCVFAVMIVGQLIAAVALLRGSPTARIFVIIYGVLFLFKFPLGTALGGYTLWALLRKKPAHIVEPFQPGATPGG